MLLESIAPCGTRTHDPRIRNPLLYPAELRAQIQKSAWDATMSQGAAEARRFAIGWRTGSGEPKIRAGERLTLARKHKKERLAPVSAVDYEI